MAPKPTQEFVPIKEIRDGVVVLKDGSLRTIILASSLNFSLKSDDERQAILFQFQNFLNSLDFSVQIVAQSRRLDIKPYLALLQSRLAEQTSDLLRIQIQEYMEFIRKFTDDTSIMTKSFFIVIPYSPALLQGTENVKSNLGFFKKKSENKKADDNLVFEENRSQLEQRVAVVEQGLVRCGVRIGRLGTEEVTELFYRIFNPGDTGKAAISES